MSKSRTQIISVVLFIREGRALEKFTDITDPDGIKRLIEVLKKELKDVEVKALNQSR